MKTNYGVFARNMTFCDVWDEAIKFVTDYKESGLAPANNKISDTSADTLYYLLYAKYGNSCIASNDLTQFKYQIFSTIYEFGPTWDKRIEIQNKIRNITDEELGEGNKSIYNRALNPSTTPTTDELSYISEQTVNKFKKAKLDKYAQQFEILNNDVTARFLAKFEKFFIQIVMPDYPVYFTNEEEDEDGNY